MDKIAIYKTLNLITMTINKFANIGPFCLLCLLLIACNTPRHAPAPAPHPPAPRPTERPRNEPMDTVRWTEPARAKPPIGSDPKRRDEPLAPAAGSTYHLALLLPFLSNQFDGTTVPDKSAPALQFYGGAQIALQQLSQEEGLNLVVDLYDTQAADADFQKIMRDPRFDKAQVYIGPIRSTHVGLLAAQTRQNDKILVSPGSPNMALTDHNAGFVQTNPSLASHCEAITQFVRRTHGADEVVLVCKEKEAERLAYFQNENSAFGGGRFAELILPDATANFNDVDLAAYLRTGRNTVFILPSWASQDFVMAFLRKLRAVKGSNRVEVFGMPQWLGYTNIEPDYWTSLNVHVSSASYIDYDAPAVRDFQRRFYEAYGALPDDDAFNGYDVTLFTGKMLRKYGLSFPERLFPERFQGLRTSFQFEPAILSGDLDDSRNEVDYMENKFVHILKFENGRFVPAAQ